MTTYEKLKEALDDGDIYDAKHYALELEAERARLYDKIDAWPDNLDRNTAILELKKRVEMIAELRRHRDALLDCLSNASRDLPRSG